MQWRPCSVLEISWFHAAWRNETLLNVVDFMQHDWMQWIPCSMFECSVVYAAWRKAFRLNAVVSMQRHWLKRIPCIVVQRIQIVYGGVHSARPNASRLNAVRFMQHGPKHPDGMQWIPCSVNECRGFHALWRNGSRLYAVESMQCDECMDSRQPGKMHPDWMQWIICSMFAAV